MWQNMPIQIHAPCRCWVYVNKPCRAITSFSHVSLHMLPEFSNRSLYSIWLPYNAAFWNTYIHECFITGEQGSSNFGARMQISRGTAEEAVHYNCSCRISLIALWSGNLMNSCKKLCTKDSQRVLNYRSTFHVEVSNVYLFLCSLRDLSWTDM